jgi:hypothetical protein
LSGERKISDKIKNKLGLALGLTPKELGQLSTKVFSKNIEGRLDDIALTLDSLVQKDTSGLMKTILETADLSEKFLIQNDVFSPKIKIKSLWANSCIIVVATCILFCCQSCF